MYSKELIEEVERLFPNDYSIISAAKKGMEILGRYLDDAASIEITPKVILEAASLEELQKKAKNLDAKRDLYNKWSDETMETIYKELKYEKTKIMS